MDQLYKTDTLIWAETQIALLRAGKFDQLDLENIIAELTYQVQSDKDEIESRLRSLMTHLLKHQFRPQQRSPRWISVIVGHRRAIKDILEQMPSLRPQLDEYVARIYPKAVRAAAQETHVHPAVFPQENSYTLDQLLDRDFFPGETAVAVDPA